MLSVHEQSPAWGLSVDKMGDLMSLENDMTYLKNEKTVLNLNLIQYL